MIKVSMSPLSYQARPLLVVALKTWLVIKASSSFVLLSLILAGGVVMRARILGWRRRNTPSPTALLKFWGRNIETVLLCSPTAGLRWGRRSVSASLATTLRPGSHPGAVRISSHHPLLLSFHPQLWLHF